MNRPSTFPNGLIAAWLRLSPPAKPHRVKKTAALTWDCLEDRVVLSHVGAGVHHLHHHAHVAAASTGTTTTSGTGTTAAETTSSGTTSTAAASTGTTSTATSGSGTTSSNSSSSGTTSAVDTARQTLANDVQTIELASGTTIGELTAIRNAFRTLETDGLSPSSESALRTFEDSLVTSLASGTTLTGNATLLSQFEALYTSTPTTQQTTDLTAAYNALAAAVTSANISSANITTINADWSALQTATGSTSASTYPYFSLVTGGGAGGGCDGGGGDLGGGFGGPGFGRFDGGFGGF